MAAIVTFADGDTLNAADLNAIVVPVPSDGDAIDVAWVSVPLSPGVTGNVSAKRTGNRVEISSSGVSTTYTTSILTNVVESGSLPDGFAPTSNRWGAAYFSGGTTHTGVCVVDGTGRIRLVQSSGATNTTAQFTISYFVG